MNVPAEEGSARQLGFTGFCVGRTAFRLRPGRKRFGVASRGAVLLKLAP
jgi:hypothetical protein